MNTIFAQIKNFDNSIAFVEGKPFEFILNSTSKSIKQPTLEVNHWYRITVKSWMTTPANTGWDFMKRYNNDIPMPCTTMTGKIISTTRSMIFMELHDNVTRQKWSGWVVRSAIIRFEEIKNGQVN